MFWRVLGICQAHTHSISSCKLYMNCISIEYIIYIVSFLYTSTHSLSHTNHKTSNRGPLYEVHQKHINIIIRLVFYLFLVKKDKIFQQQTYLNIWYVKAGQIDIVTVPFYFWL